jgi:hypothetical protein
MDDEGLEDPSQSSGMSDGTFFAIAILLFLFAGFCWYIALHPGGLQDQALVSESNPEGRVQNASGVVAYFMNRMANPAIPGAVTDYTPPKAPSKPMTPAQKAAAAKKAAKEKKQDKEFPKDVLQPPGPIKAG